MRYIKAYESFSDNYYHKQRQEDSYDDIRKLTDFLYNYFEAKYPYNTYKFNINDAPVETIHVDIDIMDLTISKTESNAYSISGSISEKQIEPIEVYYHREVAKVIEDMMLHGK
jgi:hypothetical protein